MCWIISHATEIHQFRTQLEKQDGILDKTIGKHSLTEDCVNIFQINEIYFLPLIKVIIQNAKLHSYRVELFVGYCSLDP